jgi:hypothetical protein
VERATVDGREVRDFPRSGRPGRCGPRAPSPPRRPWSVPGCRRRRASRWRCWFPLPRRLVAPPRSANADAARSGSARRAVAYAGCGPLSSARIDQTPPVRAGLLARRSTALRLAHRRGGRVAAGNVTSARNPSSHRRSPRSAAGWPRPIGQCGRGAAPTGDETTNGEWSDRAGRGTDGLRGADPGGAGRSTWRRSMPAPMAASASATRGPLRGMGRRVWANSRNCSMPPAPRACWSSSRGWTPAAKTARCALFSRMWTPGSPRRPVQGRHPARARPRFSVAGPPRDPRAGDGRRLQPVALRGGAGSSG